MSHIFLSNFKSKDEHENSASSKTSESTPNDAELGFVPMCPPGSKINAMVDEDSTILRVQEEVEVDDKRHRRAIMTPEQRGLSKVSDMYDRDNKGYLDPTEEAMRRMDSKNLGFLDNSKVYQIMQSLQTEQQKSQELIESLQKEHKKSMSLKRGIIYMSVFAFLLALSNIGTSFAAARLAKDTTISGDEMVTTSSGVRVSTTPKNIVMQITGASSGDSSSRRRMLQEVSDMVCGPYQGTGVECNVVGSLDYSDALKLYQQFCPAYPYITDISQCTNIGLPQILLQCGTRTTTIYGGSQFPTGGLPGQDGSTFVFPAPSVPAYFQGSQTVPVVVQAPATNFSLTGSSTPTYITQPCTEYLSFKLYCPSSGGGFGTCFMINTYLTNQNACSGDLRLCENTQAAA